MSWFSNAWNSITGKSANDRIAQAMAAAQAQQQQIWQQQQAEAARQKAEMERREQQRQDNIRAGNSAIDTAFAQFDDNYYGGAQNAYTDFYVPQIEQQRGDALDKLTAQLAGRGMLESTVGAKRIGDLHRTADDAKAKVGNEAVDFTNSLRGKVDASKQGLYSLSKEAADPSMVSSRATGEATTLAQTGGIAPTQPLGDLFGSILAPFANAATAYINSPQRGTTRSTNFAPVSGSGSSKVLG